MKESSGLSASGNISITEELKSALNDLKTSKIDYVLAVFKDKVGTVVPLDLCASGKGGMEHVKNKLPENDVAFGLIQSSYTMETVGTVKAETLKSVLLMWRPDVIPFQHQKILGVAESYIKKVFSPYHVTMQASEFSEVTDEAMNEVLEKVTMKSAGRLSAGAEKPTVAKAPSIFLPTGTGADTMGTAKGAEVAFKDAAMHKQILAQIRSDTDDLNWTLFRYEGNKQLVFQAKGNGGVEELQNSLSDEHVMYGYFRIVEQVDMSQTVKFCFVVWQPENMPPMKKCLISTHQGFVRTAFRPYQYDFHISDPQELTVDKVMQHIGSLTGTKSHVTERKVIQKQASYERKMLGGVTAKTQALSFTDEKVLKDAIKDVRSDSCTMDWMLATFVDSKLKLKASGSSGVSGLVASASDDTFNYGLVRLSESSDGITAVKFCFIKLQPDNMPPSQRGRLGVLNGAVTAIFEPYHGTLLAGEISEINTESVVQSVRKH